MSNPQFLNIRPRGKTHVVTEAGEPLQVMLSYGWLTIGTGDPLPVHCQRFSISPGVSEQELIAGEAGFVTRIVSMHVLGSVGATTTLRLLSKGDGAATAMSEAYPVKGGFVLTRDGDGHFDDSASGEDVVLTSGAGETLVGAVKFVRIPV